MRSLFPLLLAFFAGLVSCSSAPARFEVQGVRRVVVFPFDNLSGKANDAGRRLTAAFSASLYRSSGLEVIELGEVERFITEERIRGVDGLDSDVLRLIGTRFGVQMVVIGVVNEFDYVNISGEAVPMVGLSVRVVNPRNGRLVWSCTRSREGNDGESVFGIGKVHSLARLSELVIDDICGQMGSTSEEIAKSLEKKDGVDLPPVSKPTNGEVKVAEPQADEEREEVRRAVKRHWQLIKESREK